MCGLTKNNGVGVKFGEERGLSKRVDLLSSNLGCLAGLADSLRNLLRTHDTSVVGVSHLWSWKRESLLQLGQLGVGSVDGIKLFEGRLGPDNQTSQMSSRSDLQKIQTLHVKKTDTRDVTEGADDSVVFAVDDQRTELLLVTTVAHLSLSGAVSLGGTDLEKCKRLTFL